jgi:hypothetical protein
MFVVQKKGKPRGVSHWGCMKLVFNEIQQFTSPFVLSAVGVAVVLLLRYVT